MIYEIRIIIFFNFTLLIILVHILLIVIFLFMMIFKFDFLCDFILYFFHIKFDLHSFDCSIFCLDKFFKLIFFPITYFNIKFSGN
jgi:hypothetical protein